MRLATCLFGLSLAACATVPAPSPNRAWLGLATRAPSTDETAALELPVDVRVQGRVVTSVQPESPARRAGIEPGDILLRAAGVELYSQDDLADLVLTADPGAEFPVEVVTADDPRPRVLSITLAERPGPVDARPGLDWQFASLSGLSQALARAADERHPVLVGLSGAET